MTDPDDLRVIYRAAASAHATIGVLADAWVGDGLAKEAA
jgi:hypothetical protein